MKQKFLLITVLIGLYLLTTPLVYAQNTTIEVLDQGIESQFRDKITARLTAEYDGEITNVEFFYRIVGQLATTRNVAEFEPGQKIDASYSIDQADRDTYMPPGAEFEYWWKLTDADGNTLKTDQETYVYWDNRFDFKVLASERLSLYWYNGSRAFGERLFERAKEGLKLLETNVGVTIDRPLKIFIYGTHEDLLSALSLASQEWTGGVAYTDYGVVVIGIRADNLDWGLGAMTHELTHLVIHQATDNPYSELPTWLNEGLAVYNENPEALDLQFRESFKEAVSTNSLMTLQTLSSSFPADPEAANLAYGQSGAIVKFIINEYGTEAMAHLLEVFSEGSLADDALTEALDEDTKSLDNAFRAYLGLPPLPGTVAAQAETEESQPETSDTQEAANEPAQTEQPAAESPAAENVETETASAEQASEETRPGRRFGCLGGLLPLVAFGVFITHRRRKP